MIELFNQWWAAATHVTQSWGILFLTIGVLGGGTILLAGDGINGTALGFAVMGAIFLALGLKGKDQLSKPTNYETISYCCDICGYSWSKQRN